MYESFVSRKSNLELKEKSNLCRHCLRMPIEKVVYDGTTAAAAGISGTLFEGQNFWLFRNGAGSKISYR
jgi:hypothetical protein